MVFFQYINNHFGPRHTLGCECYLLQRLDFFYLCGNIGLLYLDSTTDYVLIEWALSFYYPLVYPVNVYFVKKTKFVKNWTNNFEWGFVYKSIFSLVCLNYFYWQRLAAFLLKWFHHRQFLLQDCRVVDKILVC